MVIRGNQWSSEVGATSEYPSSEEERRDCRRACWRDVGGPDEGGNQWSSEGINGHQRQSVVIRAGEMSADLMRAAIDGHPRASVVIRGRRTWGGSDEGW